MFLHSLNILLTRFFLEKTSNFTLCDTFILNFFL